MVSHISGPAVTITANDPSNPEYVYQRRKAIIEAIAFEWDIEDAKCQDLEKIIETKREELEKLEDELTEAEGMADALKDAANNIHGTLTFENQARLIQETDYSEFLSL